MIENFLINTFLAVKIYLALSVIENHKVFFFHSTYSWLGASKRKADINLLNSITNKITVFIWLIDFSSIICDKRNN